MSDRDALERDNERLRAELERLRGARGALGLADLDAILRALGVLFFTFDEDDRFLEYRAPDEGSLYLPPDRFMGRRVDEVIPPPLGARLLDAVRTTRAGRGPGALAYEMETAAGRRDFEARLVPLGDGRVASLVLDVTERVRAERDARESRERLASLIEGSTDLLAVLDAEGRYGFWSPGATEALGWTAAEALGRHALELVHPDDLGEAGRVLGEVAARPGAAGRVRCRVQHRDGRWRVLDVSGRNLAHVPAVAGIVMNARDVTEEVRLEEQVRESQRLESVGRLAGGVAHDFNNLLTVILSCVESLRGAVPAGPVAEDVAEIGTAGERARDLTRQLLAFARRQVIAPRSLDVSALVRESERLLRRVLGEDVELAVHVAAVPALVHGDPAQLQQVLINLAMNARDAMPRGGKLTVEVAHARFGAEHGGAHPEVAPGPWVLLAVSDTGEGMTPEARAHAFEPFFTTKPAGRGTGLGLATVYGIVKQSGGHVWLHSERGRGTTVEIHLPLVEGIPAPAPEAATPRGPAAGGTETVLVLEDEASVREVAARALRSAGYRVLVARDGPEALAVCAAAAPPPRLLVSDVVLPGMSGREAAEALCSRVPGLRVLYVSGYTQDAIVHRGALDPGIDFLPKPFTPSALVERVRELLDRPR